MFWATVFPWPLYFYVHVIDGLTPLTHIIWCSTICFYKKIVHYNKLLLCNLTFSLKRYVESFHCFVSHCLESKITVKINCRSYIDFFVNNLIMFFLGKWLMYVAK